MQFEGQLILPIRLTWTWEVELLKEGDLLVYFLQTKNIILPKHRFSIAFGALTIVDSSLPFEVYVSKSVKLKGTDFVESFTKHCAVWVYLKRCRQIKRKRQKKTGFSYFIRYFECTLIFQPSLDYHSG